MRPLPERRAKDCHPRFSTDIAAAWLMVEKFHAIGLEFAVGPRWCDVYRDHIQIVGVSGASAPHAICLAALEAVGAVTDWGLTAAEVASDHVGFFFALFFFLLPVATTTNFFWAMSSHR